ncbi:FCD domain-containing protein [Micromonospora tulbaghiae]
MLTPTSTTVSMCAARRVDARDVPKKALAYCLTAVGAGALGLSTGGHHGHRRRGRARRAGPQMPLVWRTFSHYSPEALRRSLAHHHELVAALTAADPDWAESVMRSHVRAAWHSIRPDHDL